MNKNPNILLRKKDADHSLWISENYLLELLPSLNANYLWKKARPAFKKSVKARSESDVFLPCTGRSWRFGKENNTFYYDYNFIPDKAPSFYRSQLPTREAIIEKAEREQPEIEAIETFIKPYLNEHYKAYLHCYGECTPDQQINLAKAASLLQAAKDFILQNDVDTSKRGFYENYASVLRAIGTKYMPHSHISLKRLITRSNQTTDNVIKLPRSGNGNAASHKSDTELESWLIQMRSIGKNYTNSYIIRKLQLMCALHGKPEPSARCLGAMMESDNVRWLTAPERFGAKGKYANKFNGYTPLKNAVHAGDCWQVDGSRVNLVDFKLNGKKVFLYIVAVRDAHSGDILGYAFDISENRWVVQAALKMAVEETGYLPYELVFDKFPGHNTPEIKSLIADLETRKVKVTFANKATSKPGLERWFSTLQQVFMQESEYYYGEGVQSRNKAAHRSKETLKKIKAAAKKDGWNYDTAVNETCKILEAYRSTQLCVYSRKFKSITLSPSDIHTQSEKPNVINIEPNQITWLFGLRTQKKFEGEGLINIQIQNQFFSYRCADVNVVSRYAKVSVCYDLEDLSQVHMYEISEKALKKYLGVAKEISIQLYGPDAEFGKLQVQQTIIKNMQAERQRQLSMKLAAGDDVALLMQGVEDKHVYEDAETNFLTNVSDDDEEVEGDYDISNQYS